MPRYQLLIRELGKAPRVVPVMQTLVVGRSRRADVVIEDEEVSREQFRIGLQGAMVFVEGIGKTNRTTVDGTAVDAGQRVTVAVGASIRIGRTVLQLQTGEPTESPPARPGSLDATMVAPAPPSKRPVEPDAAPALPEQEQTGGFRGPRDALPTPAIGMGPGAGPGAKKPDTQPEDFGQTLNLKSAFRPGAPKPDATPTPPTMPPSAPPPRPPGSTQPPKSESGFGQTIEVKRGYRPGQAEPPPQAPADDVPGLTINVPGGYRPGQGMAPPTPAPPSPPTPVPTRPPSQQKPTAPEPRPPRAEQPAPPPPAPPAAPAAAPTPPAKPADAVKPKTVYVSPEQMVPRSAVVPPSSITPALAADVEGRLHQALPRLFVKGDTIRRRVRLMKARTRIGRAETADVLLPNESVSELHAEIEFDGTTWSLRDCGSTNGTLVNNEILRGRSAPIARNSLLGFGSLRGLFLCNDPASAAADRRDEERALRLLVSAGRLAKDVGKQVLALARRDSNQTIAEILLGDTPIEPGDWANAIAAVKGRRTLLDRLRALFTRRPKPPAR